MSSTSALESVKILIGELLAFIILFEKKIEQLKIKLASNEEFHSRLAFQLIDKHRKSTISSEDLHQVLNLHYFQKSLPEVEAFCQKYTSNGLLSYDEFIKFLTPNTNKILAQKLMIRTYKQGAFLPNSVIYLLLQIFSAAVTMTNVTQKLRKQIQSSTGLTHLQILDLFRKNSTPRQKLFYFINASANGSEEYNFLPEEMDYLTFHTRRRFDLQDITDQQIKQILCPLEMNYQKNSTYSPQEKTSKADYFKTKFAFQNINKGKQMKDQLRRNEDFLTKSYQQTSKIFYLPKEAVEPKGSYLTNNKNSMASSNSYTSNEMSELSYNYNNMYIQKFIWGSQNQRLEGLEHSKQTNFPPNSKVRQQKLFQKHKPDQKEFFEDELNNQKNNNKADCSDVSGESAFMQY